MNFYIDNDNKAHFSTYIASASTDSYYTTRVSEYQSLIQEAAALHATYRSVGIPDLQKEGKTWVIARSRMEAFHYGSWRDSVEVTTWAQKPQGLNCPRVVEAIDQDGNKLFHAMTRWAIIDTVNGRPLRPGFVSDILKTVTESEEENSKLPSLMTYKEEAPTLLKTYSVRINYLDTDYNHHVNNRSYTNWILEALPNEFMDSYKPALLDVKWGMQSFRHDNLEVRVMGKDDNAFIEEEPHLFFEIIRKECDGSENTVFEAYSEWKKRELF